METIDQYKKNIYVVDDDPVYTNIITFQLSKLGYTNIETYSTGKECIDNLYKIPDIILLDYNLTDTEGIEVLKEIVSFDPDIVVIFLSGQNSIAKAVDTLRYGAFHYVAKDNEAAKNIHESITKAIQLQKKIERKVNKEKLIQCIGKLGTAILLASTLLTYLM